MVRSTLRWRLAQIILLSLGAFAVVSVLVEQLFLHTFFQTVTASSEHILSLVSRNLDDRMRDVQSLSFAVMTNREVQQDLDSLTRSDISYARGVAGDALVLTLQDFAFQQPYIEEVTVIDGAGREHNAGRNLSPLSATVRSRAESLALEAGGGNVWLFDPSRPSELYAVRMARRTANLDLSRIGTVVVTVNPNLLAQAALQYLNVPRVSLAIGKDAWVAFSAASPPHDLPQLMHSLEGGGSGTQVVSLQGQRFFAAYVTSSFMGWVVVGVVPYSTLISGVLPLANLSLIALAMSFCVIVVLGIGFVRGMTRPIEKLSRAMRSVDTYWDGAFGRATATSSKIDEVRTLYYEFNMMLERIGSLSSDIDTRDAIIHETKLRALQSQINPHFLYNVLESVNSLAKLNGQNEIAEMVRSLGNLFRSSLQGSEQVVPIRDELLLLEDYLRIQRVRFGERLSVRLSIAQDITGLLIPKLSIQPIVENAIAHVLETRPGPCAIEIRGERQGGGLLRVTVTDDGPGIPDERVESLRTGSGAQTRERIGLKNIDDRVKMIFGATYGVEIKTPAGGGTVVTLTLPAREAIGNAEPSPMSGTSV